MLALASLTMPSSRDHASSRESWKYKSAKSTECVSTSPNTRSSRLSSRPPGLRIRSRAMLNASVSDFSAINAHTPAEHDAPAPESSVEPHPGAGYRPAQSHNHGRAADAATRDPNNPRS